MLRGWILTFVYEGSKENLLTIIKIFTSGVTDLYVTESYFLGTD